jgi:ketopantoate reductase
MPLPALKTCPVREGMIIDTQSSRAQQEMAQRANLLTENTNAILLKNGKEWWPLKELWAMKATPSP